MSNSLLKTRVVEGDITDTDAALIVHQVNCQFVMGSGVAKAIRDKYPMVYDAYIKLRDDNLKHQLSDNYQSYNYLGHAQFVHIGDFRYVVNLFGQDRYGYDGARYTSYDAVECALYAIKRKLLFCQDIINDVTNRKLKTSDDCGNICKIAFPWKMGSERGGGDWNIIKEMIERVFADMNIEIIYYKLDKG